MVVESVAQSWWVCQKQGLVTSFLSEQGALAVPLVREKYTLYNQPIGLVRHVPQLVQCQLVHQNWVQVNVCAY